MIPTVYGLGGIIVRATRIGGRSVLLLVGAELAPAQHKKLNKNEK
jgi:hypothetical protein